MYDTNPYIPLGTNSLLYFLQLLHLTAESKDSTKAEHFLTCAQKKEVKEIKEKLRTTTNFANYYRAEGFIVWYSTV